MVDEPESTTTNERRAVAEPVVAPSSRQASGPVLLWAETEYDFGAVFSGTTIEHEFEATNIGSAPARIEVRPRSSGTYRHECIIYPGQTCCIPVQILARAHQEAQREYKLDVRVVPLE